MALTRRLQVLLDDERYRRLERRSTETGASVGALVRRAIDDALPPSGPDPQTAAQDLLDAPAMPVGDWEHEKRAMLDAAGDAPGA